VIPGPRPAKGHGRPTGGRGAARAGVPAAHLTSTPGLAAAPDPGTPCQPLVSVSRTPRGWAVVTPRGVEPAADLVEALSLADLVAEEYGISLEPDRSTRRSARGPAEAACAEAEADPRVAALERTVAQLEHALAARVTTERAIGVLAERNGTGARAAFEALRQEARSQGRPVHQLAREVLDGLPADDAATPQPRAENARTEGVTLHVAATGPQPPATNGRVRRVPAAAPAAGSAITAPVTGPLASGPAADRLAEGRS
jgi:ANTAR domain